MHITSKANKINIFLWFFYFVVSCGKYSNLSSIIIFVWFFGKPIVFIILYKYKNRNRQMIILLYSSWSSRCSSCHSPESGLHHMQCSNPQSIYHQEYMILEIGWKMIIPIKFWCMGFVNPYVIIVTKVWYTRYILYHAPITYNRSCEMPNITSIDTKY